MISPATAAADDSGGGSGPSVASGHAGTLEVLAGQVGLVLQPLQDQLTQANIIPFLANLGLQFPPELAGQAGFTDALTAGSAAAGALPNLLTQLATAITDGDDDRIVSAGAELIEQIAAIVTALKQIASQLSAAAIDLPGMNKDEVTAFAQNLASNLLSFLLISYLEQVQPAAVGVGNLLGIIDYIPEPGVTGDPTHPPYIARTLRLSNLGSLLTSPDQLMKTLVGWGDPDFDGTLLIPRLSTSLNLLGLISQVVTPGPGNALEAGLLSVTVNPDTDPPGLLATLNYPINDGFTFSFPLTTTWSVQISTQGTFDVGLQAILTPPADISLKPPSGSLTGRLMTSLTATAPGPGAPIIILGQVGGSRLQVSSFTFTIGLNAQWDPGSGSASANPTVLLSLSGGQAVIDTSQADGFLSELLSGANVQAAFTLQASWNPSAGLQISGGGQLGIDIPLNLDLDLVSLQMLHLIGTLNSSGVNIEASVGLAAALGPVSAAVDRIGMQASLSFPADGGNLGPAGFSLSFKPPGGVGLAIAASVVSGSGFLDFDVPDARYYGAVQLAIPPLSLSVSAVGLVTTRLPGGQAGYSMVVVISATFPPVQLGFGLSLTGVGGLLGINRTVAIDPLRAGLQSGSLDLLLSPAGLSSDPAKIVVNLEQYFPAAVDQYVFGPSVDLEWGEDSLVTAHLGVYLEFPSPFRIIVAGQLRMILPTAAEATVDIQLDVLGSLDLTNKLLSIDAALRNSHVASFTLSGQAALRAAWGSAPVFLLAVGGFHPKFQPPAGFPALQRVTISLSQSKNPRLRLQAYLALTSNTAQVGAELDLYAYADIPVLGTFAIAATLSFDALFQFLPFRFEIDITASVALLRNGTPFLGVSLSVTLTGFQPCHAAGKATFTFFGTHSIPFEITVGLPAADPPPARVSLLPGILADLARPDSRVLQPPSQHSLITLGAAATAAAGQLVHPFATLSVRERTAPLGVTLAKAGSALLSDGPSYTITTATLGTLTSQPLTDEFAPGQFLNLTADQQLSAPSFETFTAGAQFDGSALVTPTDLAQSADTSVLTYTLTTAGADTDTPAAALAPALAGDPGTTTLGDDIVLQQLAGAAAARSGAANRGARAYAGPGLGAAVPGPSYAVAATQTLAPVSAGGTSLTGLASYTIANQDLVQAAPAAAGGLQVVQTQESMAPALPPVAAGISPVAYYTLTAVHSGCRLEAGQAGTGWPALRQNSPRDDGTQFWRLLPLGDGSYALIAEESGLLASTAGGTADGTRVMLSGLVAGAGSRWQLIPLAGNRYRIDEAASGRCLDVIGGPTATTPGTGVQLWDWWAGANQTWQLQAVSAGSVLRQRIRERAYQRWQVRGEPLWQQLTDWDAAEAEVVQAAIAVEAWWRYTRRGGSGGHALDDWLAAEATIREELES
jgi:hypothetical protein